MIILSLETSLYSVILPSSLFLIYYITCSYLFWLFICKKSLRRII